VQEYYFIYCKYLALCGLEGRHGRNSIVVGFTTDCVISAYHH